MCSQAVRILSLAGCFLVAGLAHADFVVPRLLNGMPLATNEGEDVSNVSGLFGTSDDGIGPAGDGTARLFQMAASELTANGLQIGDRITGVRSRLDVSQAAGGPAADVLVADFQVTMAQAANSIIGMSNVFADNLLNPQLVRSGAYTIAANSLSGGGNPNTFGSLVSFDTPYVYQGGDLVFMFRRSAIPGWNLPQDATRLYDGNEPEGGPVATTLYRTLDDRENFGALTGTLQRFTPVFEFVSVPEPGAVMLAGVAVLFAGMLGRPSRRRAN